MKIRIATAFAIVTALAGRLEAATFTVTNSNDSGAGSLRQAIADANATAAADTISFNTAGHFSVARTITLTTGELDITKPLTIDAPPAAGQRVTISGNGASRVFKMTATAATTVTVRNLTIQNGSSTYNGGAILIDSVNALLNLENCTVAINACGERGGGIMVDGGTLNATDCTFSGNVGHTEGGAIHFRGGQGAIHNCTLFGNSFDTANLGLGGGVCVRNNASVVVTGTTLSLNTAHAGAGIYVDQSDVTFDGCVFSANTAVTGGGGLESSASTASVVDSTFSGNDSENGGAINVKDSVLSAIGCTFSNNDATERGGAIIAYEATTGLTLTNCTLSANSAGTSGGGVVGLLDATITITNCTITGNSAPNGGGINAYSTPNIAIGNSIVAGNSADVSDDSDLFISSIGSGIQSRGHNLIGIDPAGGDDFDPGSEGDLVGTTTNPLNPLLGPLQANGGPTFTRALLFGSPAIEAGDSTLVAAPAFASPPYKDQRGQARITGGQVDIGAYEFPALEVTNTNDLGAGSLRDVVNQANGVGGGVITFRENVFGASRQTINLTSGQIAITSSISILAPNVRVLISGTNNSRIFNITAGNVTLDGLDFSDGSSTAEGGAVRVAGAATTLLATGVTITGCQAVAGGALVVDAGTATLTNCAIVSNTTTGGGGGGIKVTSSGVLRLTNSTLSGNACTGEGGGLFHESGESTMINCTLADNTADSNSNGAGNGGGIIRSAGTVSLGNSIVASNTDSSAGTKHPDISGIFSTLGHNVIGKSDGGTGFSNSANGDKVGSIASPLNPQLGALVSNQYYLPNAAAPSVDAGDSSLLSHAAWPMAPDRDQRGQYRTVGTAVDMGATEGPAGTVVKLTVTDSVASEHGLSPAKFRLRRSFTNTSLAVNLNIEATGSASISDYTVSGPGYASTGPSSFAVAFPLNDDSILITITPTQDNVIEGIETVLVSLNPLGYSVDPSEINTRSVDILDDEFSVTSSASSGAGSLRSAINAANDAGGGKITIPSPLNITLGGTPLSIDSDTEIIGNASTISAAKASRVFDVIGDGGGCVKLQGLVITGGQAPATEDGGGVRMDNACVEIRGCAVLSNAAGGHGGGIFAGFNNSSLTIVNTSIVSNSAGFGGGGLSSFADSCLLTNVTIGRNTAKYDGGGVDVSALIATVEFTNCTLTENVADSDNNDSGNGGGLFWPSGTVVLNNTVISGNFDTAGNAGSGTVHPNLSTISGTASSGGGNFIGNRFGVASLFATGSPNAGGDYVGTPAAPLDPLLFFQNDVKPFYAFAPPSLLQNHGINVLNTEPNDMRGRSRVAGGTVDIGAVELTAFLVTNANDLGAGSFRQIIASASAVGGDVFFDPNYFNIQRIISLTSEIAISDSVEVYGLLVNNAPAVRLSGLNACRILKLTPAGAAKITLRNLQIESANTTTNSPGDQSGAGILANGNTTLALYGCIVQSCISPADGGGVLLQAGSQMTAYDSEFLICQASRGGGLASLGTASLERCTFNQCRADLYGAGFLNAGPASLVNCTFGYNLANEDGGGIYHAGLLGSPLDLLNCTLTGNRADYDGNSTGTGAGIRRFSGPVNLKNTLLALNVSGNAPSFSAPQLDVFGSVNSQGHNLVGAADPSSGLVNGANGDHIGSTAIPLAESIGVVQNNGGFTPTAAIFCNSQSYNAGDVSGAPATDQRGLLRVSGSAPDIGAYELQPETYAYWASHSLGGTNAGEFDDYDGDGRKNANEYLTGTDPFLRDNYYPTATVANGTLKFLVNISPLAVPGSYQVRFSSDLQNWSLAPTSTTPISCGTGGVLTEFARPASSARMFARLEYISLP